MTDMKKKFSQDSFDRTFKISSYQSKGSAADELREEERNLFYFTGK